MKNIHVIPTEKPSPIMTDGGKLLYSKTFGINEFNETKNFKHINKHSIYITSNDKINDGDWVYNIVSKTKFKASKQLINLINNPNVTLTTNKKIILTTDQDLIKDGVKSIGDEFLEWFVKNPECESVEVKPMLSNNGRVFYGYKIIIPKESFSKMKDEYKSISKAFEDYLQNTSKEEIDRLAKPISDLPNKGVTYEEYIDIATNAHQPIEETLEEAAENYDKKYIEYVYDAFIVGAKWQAERMYSEKEMFSIIAEILHTPSLIDGSWEEISEWFEQYKSKMKEKTVIKQAIELLEQQRKSLQEMDLLGVLLENELTYKSDQINSIQLLLAKLLPIEKKQIIDFHIEVMKIGLIEEGDKKWSDCYLPKIKETAEKYYGQNFGDVA